MKDYKEFQFGWIIFAVILPIQLLITYLFINDLGDKPFGILGFSLVTSFLILTYFCFYGLTTTVSKEKITIVYGIGFPRRTININEVKSVEVVESPWYYGWGIRFFPKGILYNITGTKGVELQLTDREDVIRIGSKEPFQLKLEIKKRIK